MLIINIEFVNGVYYTKWKYKSTIMNADEDDDDDYDNYIVRVINLVFFFL